MPSKLCSKEEIVKISEKLKSEGKTIVTTNGSFDILHPAHINLLEKAKKEGDILIILLNSDNSIKKLKEKYEKRIKQEDSYSGINISGYDGWLNPEDFIPRR